MTKAKEQEAPRKHHIRMRTAEEITPMDYGVYICKCGIAFNTCIEADAHIAEVTHEQRNEN